MAMRRRLPNAGAWRAVIVWNGFILRRPRRRVERLIGSQSSLGGEPEPADQLALELGGLQFAKSESRETAHPTGVIPGRRASAGPGIHNHSLGVWIPGSRRSLRP